MGVLLLSYSPAGGELQYLDVNSHGWQPVYQETWLPAVKTNNLQICDLIMGGKDHFLLYDGDTMAAIWRNEGRQLKECATFSTGSARGNRFSFLFSHQQASYVLGYRTKDGEATIFRITIGSGLEPAGVYTWPSGFDTFSPFLLDGDPHLLCYSSLGGAAMLVRFGWPQTPSLPSPHGFAYLSTPTVEVTCVWQWEKGLSVTPISLDRQPYVLFYKPTTGAASFRRLSPSGVLSTLWTDSWTQGWTFTPVVLNGMPCFFSYKPTNGLASLDRFNVDGRSYANLWRCELPPHRMLVSTRWTVMTAMSLRVMTLNVFHDVTRDAESTMQRLQRQVRQVAQQRPHVVCLQEAYDPRVRQIYHAGFAEYEVISEDSPLVRRADRPHVVKSLCITQLFYAVLTAGVWLSLFRVVGAGDIGATASYAVFSPLAVWLGLGFVGAAVDADGDSGDVSTAWHTELLLAYLLVRLACMHSKYLSSLNAFLTDTSLGLVILVHKQFVRPVHGSFKAVRFAYQRGDVLNVVKPRGFLSGKVVLTGVQHEEQVVIINTHLNTGVTNPHRIHQVQELLRAHPPSECSVILCGDTNAHCEEPEMKYLFDPNGGGFVDMWGAYGIPDTTNGGKGSQAGYTWDNNNPLTAGLLREPDQRVDYVCYRHGWASLQRPHSCRLACNLEPFVSDHYGVVAEFRVLPGPEYR